MHSFIDLSAKEVQLKCFWDKRPCRHAQTHTHNRLFKMRGFIILKYTLKFSKSISFEELPVALRRTLQLWSQNSNNTWIFMAHSSLWTAYSWLKTFADGCVVCVQSLIVLTLQTASAPSEVFKIQTGTSHAKQTFHGSAADMDDRQHNQCWRHFQLHAPAENQPSNRHKLQTDPSILTRWEKSMTSTAVALPLAQALLPFTSAKNQTLFGLAL